MRAVVVVVVLVSSLAFAEVRKVPPPAQLVARPIEVGQWAAYHERVGGRDAGNVMLLAVNRAECGVQFLAVLEGGDSVRRWIFCVDDEHRIVKATLDGKLVALRDHVDELGALLTRVLPPQFAGTFTREDVLVPAGYFEGVQRKDGKTITWLHPAVPLGAVVRVKDGEREDVLIAYGNGVPIDEMPVVVRARHRRTTFFEAGIGTGYRSATPSADRVNGFSVATGVEATRMFDVMAWSTGFDNRSQVASDAAQTAMLDVLLAVRCHPFARRYSDSLVGAPYVDLGVGWAHVGTGDMPSGNGFAAGLRIGWELINAGPWALGVQGQYLIDRTFGDVAGSHHLVDGTIAVRLQLP